MPGAGIPPHWGVLMSEHLNKLKREINRNYPPGWASVQYAKQKLKSENLTNEMIKRGQVPKGQGCAYSGGFPV